MRLTFSLSQDKTGTVRYGTFRLWNLAVGRLAGTEQQEDSLPAGAEQMRLFPQ